MGFSIFKRRKNAIYSMIDKYISKIYESIHFFNKTMEVYFQEGISKEFVELIEKTHHSESTADDIRREIEISFYEKSLIPESRADILGLIELIDKVFNKAQSVLYQIETEHLIIPKEFHNEFKELIGINIEAYNNAIEGFKTLFTNINKVVMWVKRVDIQESASDRKERNLIRKIFKTKMETGEKILFKELVIEIGRISDLSEEATDFLSIIAVKKMI